MAISESDSETENDILNVGKYYVYAVNIIIILLTFTSQYFVIDPYIKEQKMYRLLYLAIFDMLSGYIILNYNLSCRVNPGVVSLGWEPPRSGLKVLELKRYSNKPRYCRYCKCYKPPRSHHCTDCPWINNCVGFKNQGHFWRLYELISDAYRGTFYNRQPSQTEVSFLIINVSALVITLLCVGALFCYQTYLVSRNTTSIESSEIKRVKKLAKKNRDINTIYPYNLGIIRNFMTVLGDNMLTFWLPKPIVGDGVDFEIKNGLALPVYWPPYEYYLQYNNSEKKNKHFVDMPKQYSVQSNHYSDKSEGPSSSEDSRADSDDDIQDAFIDSPVDIKSHVAELPDYRATYMNSGLISKIRHRSHGITTRDNDYSYNPNLDITFNGKTSNIAINSGINDASFYNPRASNFDKKLVTKNNTAYKINNGHSLDDFSDEDIPLMDLYSKIQHKKAAEKIL
ncbi:hypothetical protein BB561_005675 [Smittium simulii]|uniref:Palmitoyltransferase n=1 Tax=Smittium simulii TaxID=133385 RepID=A0A2T9Y950_9FUNG|nr:hypothetical protein BB561_005675 [Smittium simulii]